MTPTFTGIEVPAHLDTTTLPAKRDVLRELLIKLADQVLPSEPQFDHCACDAAVTGAANLVDKDEAEEVPVTPTEFSQLLPLVGAGFRVVFSRRHWRELEVRDRRSDSANGPGARIVQVECVETLRVSVVGLSGRLGELHAHIKVEIEGDYNARD